MGDRLKLHVPDVAERWIEHSYPWRMDEGRPQRYEDGVPLLLPGRSIPRIWLPSGHIVPAQVRGGARNFVAASSQYLTGTPPVTNIPLTMAAWVNPTTNPNTCEVICLAENSLSANYAILYAASGTPQFVFKGGGSYGNATATTSLTTGAWSHLAAVAVSTSDRRIFKSGGNKGTNTTTLTLSSITTFRIGRFANSNFTEYWNGHIAEVAIWNVALSDAEVALLGQAGGLSPLLMHPESLVFYAPLIGQYSPEIDIKGGLSLTVTGATASAHPRVFYPSAGRSRVIPAAGAAAVGGPLVGGKLAGGFLAGGKLAH